MGIPDVKVRRYKELKTIKQGIGTRKSRECGASSKGVVDMKRQENTAHGRSMEMLPVVCGVA